MKKYEKFVFQELPKNSVVNSYDSHEANYKDDLVNHVITQHLETIIPETNEIEEKPNIDEIKEESYAKGFNDAKMNYEKIISDLQIKNVLAENLHNKISEISSDINLDLQIAKITSQIISGIAKKIYLILPVDFEQILKIELLESLKKIYKEGLISLSVNPDKYDFCRNILQVENLPAKLKENIQIIKDDNINIDDCKLQWANTTLEYNKEQISVEIEKILEQIKTIA